MPISGGTAGNRDRRQLKRLGAYGVGEVLPIKSRSNSLRLRDPDLLIAIGLAFVMVPLTNYDVMPFRAIFGIPVVLFFPGYLLIAALFPRRTDMDGIRRVVFGMGLSLALVPLTLLILNATPAGITRMAILLTATTLIAATAGFAIHRRRTVAGSEEWSVALGVPLARLAHFWHGRSYPARVAALAFVIGNFGLLGIWLNSVQDAQLTEAFTEFYLLGADGKAEAYPERLAPGQTGKVTVGINNQEHGANTYEVEVLQDGERIYNFGPIVLARLDRWQQEVSFEAKAGGARSAVQFLLFRGGFRQPYRSLNLWVDSGSS